MNIAEVNAKLAIELDIRKEFDPGILSPLVENAADAILGDDQTGSVCRKYGINRSIIARIYAEIISIWFQDGRGSKELVGITAGFSTPSMLDCFFTFLVDILEKNSKEKKHTSQEIVRMCVVMVYKAWAKENENGA